jgi:hypothetical protein
MAAALAQVTNEGKLLNPMKLEDKELDESA